ncbi:MAG: beta-lactamase family protein [Actinomycetia bacterium]|nr:beta-lactamase family protein [Actinomycetes bacterium]
MTSLPQPSAPPRPSARSLAAALAEIDHWPVGVAATAVVDASGVVATRGPIDHEFPLASVTKPLVALAILLAVEEGAVGLFDPVDPALLHGAAPSPGRQLRLGDPPLPEVTLRHLLAHASGLAPDAPTRLFPPAHRRVYSNVGFELAAQMVAAATGIPFSTYFTEALAPLRLCNTSLPGSPAHGGVSAVADLARVVRELLAPRGLLHPSTLAEATTVQYPGLRGVLPGFGHQDPNDWGLGFEIRARKSPHWTGARNSPATFGHFGQAGTMFWVDPAAGLGLVALTDTSFGPWAASAWPALSDAVLTAR